LNQDFETCSSLEVELVEFRRGSAGTTIARRRRDSAGVEGFSFLVGDIHSTNLGSRAIKIELNALSIDEVLEPRGLNGREVHKDVSLRDGFVRSDEAEALGSVEPLDSTSAQQTSSKGRVDRGANSS
jgi:hypothetical protein